MGDVQQTEGKRGLVGEVVDGRYEVLAKLGAGGMGVVYRARQVGVDREVALKVLSPALTDDAEGLARFEREARIVSRLRHPHTVTLHDFGRTADGAAFMVMELLRGRSLNQCLREGGPASDAEALEIVDQVCASLEEAHALGVVHRDIKPDNIFLDEVPGRALHVKVLDFGLARIGSEAGKLTHTGAVMGTPEYISPEQVAGRPCDARTDVYQVGVLLFHLLSGRPPFTAETAIALLMKHAREAPPDLAVERPELEPALPALVARMLSKAAEDRPQTVTEVRRTLAGVRTGSASGAASRPEMVPAAFSSTAGASDLALSGEAVAPPPSEVRSAPPSRRWAGAAVAAVVLGAGLLLWGTQRAEIASPRDAGPAAASPGPVASSAPQVASSAPASAAISAPAPASLAPPPPAPHGVSAAIRAPVRRAAQNPGTAPATAPAAPPSQPAPSGLDEQIERELREIHPR